MERDSARERTDGHVGGAGADEAATSEDNRTIEEIDPNDMSRKFN